MWERSCKTRHLSVSENTVCYNEHYKNTDTTSLLLRPLLTSYKGYLLISVTTLCIMDLIFSNKYEIYISYCKIQAEIQRRERLNNSLQKVYLCLTSSIRRRAFEQIILSNMISSLEWRSYFCLIKKIAVYMYLLTLLCALKCKFLNTNDLFWIFSNILFREIFIYYLLSLSHLLS